MPDIVDLENERIKRSAHQTGKAHCLACGHRWVAVAPAGTVWLECPACETQKGLLDLPVQGDGLYWVCQCGNDLFHVMPDGYYCPNCGTRQAGF